MDMDQGQIYAWSSLAASNPMDPLIVIEKFMYSGGSESSASEGIDRKKMCK